MYAIIETGGKQEKVAVGDVVAIERIPNEKSVTFDHVLLVVDGEKLEVGQPYLPKAKVKGEVVEHFLNKKVVSFIYRRRKSSRRIVGHRQELTRVKITDIALG